MKILNMTQHEATEEQIKQGVVEPEPAVKEEIRSLLTFQSMPTSAEVTRRAEQLAEIADNHNFWYAMIGGAPFLMPALDAECRRRSVKPLFAFSKRESVEETLPSGEIKKSSIFRHIGFVEG